MQLVQSLCLGREGDYSFLGTNISFVPNEKEDLSQKCLDFLFFRSHLQTLVHEIGHMMPWKYSGRSNISLTISTGNLANTQGRTRVKQYNRTPTQIVTSSLFGVVFDLGFSLVQLIFFRTIKQFLHIYLFPLLCIGPTYHLCNEIRTQILSCYRKDQGDFGTIRKEGWTPLALSVMAVVAELSLGAFALS